MCLCYSSFPPLSLLVYSGCVEDASVSTNRAPRVQSTYPVSVNLVTSDFYLTSVLDPSVSG